jgi:hypothetical protein
MIKFISDLRQVSGFLRFPSPIKLTADTVKPAGAVTSIKHSPVLKDHFSCLFIHRKFHMNIPAYHQYGMGLRPAAASDKVYQLLAHGRLFSPGTPASSTTKTGCHDIASNW